jgi:hypothetical protein
MKKILFFGTTSLFLLACTSSNDSYMMDKEDTEMIGSLVPCENGMAGEYPCNGYDLLAQISLEGFESASGNDIWGWTDTTTGKEYALMGLDDGTAFVDISDT